MTGPSAPGPALTDEPEPSARHAGAVGEGLPRTRLATLPTPLLPAPRLSEAVGVEVWIKRDDMTGLGLGGNKARKLEFLCGEALARGADTLVTGGGSGSNHVQLTAAAAARLGLGCVAVCYGTDPAPAEPATAGPGAGPSSGSATAALGLRLTRRFGADVIFTGSPDRTSVDAGLEEVAAKLAAEGRVPYVIPRGGASAVGAVGYAVAAAELSDQLASAGLAAVTLLVATGSCGTQAGLLAGAAMAGAPYEVIGVTVSRPAAESRERVRALAAGAAEIAGEGTGAGPAAIPEPNVLGGWLGPGYGIPSADGRAAARLVAAAEGVFLDPTFGAKAMAALIAECRAGRVRGTQVFLVSGGAPTLFTSAFTAAGDGPL